MRISVVVVWVHFFVLSVIFLMMRESLAGDGVFDLPADECLDLSGELSWREDSRECSLDVR